MSDRSFIESWSLHFDDIAFVEGFNLVRPGLDCLPASVFSAPMVVSRRARTTPAPSACAISVFGAFRSGTIRPFVPGLSRYAKGLAHHDEEEAQAAARELKRSKGYLWNGNHRDALPCIDGLLIDGLLDDLEELTTTYPGIKAFRKGVDEFRTYIRRNADTIPNYAERYRYGERVSTAFAESTVNAGRRQTLLETPADALVAARGAPDAPDPNAGARRHAQGEVPELVPRALARAKRCPLRLCPRRLTPWILVLPMTPITHCARLATGRIIPWLSLPKYHCLTFLVRRISGSRSPLQTRVDCARSTRQTPPGFPRPTHTSRQRPPLGLYLPVPSRRPQPLLSPFPVFAA